MSLLARPGMILGDRSRTQSLDWYSIGVGWLPLTQFGIGGHSEIRYGERYFEDFQRKAATALGKKIMQTRVNFVMRHYKGPLCDVGIGSGAFIEARRKNQAAGGPTFGYDVNFQGIKWLQKRNILFDPNVMPFPAITLWDVLEHIPDFSKLLNNVLEWVFISTPIYNDADHVLRSKHYKPGEHCWYFTSEGLIEILEQFNFELREENREETELGREDIGSFAFRRR